MRQSRKVFLSFSHFIIFIIDLGYIETTSSNLYIPLVIQKLVLPTPYPKERGVLRGPRASSGSHCFWDLLASPNPLGLRFFKHRLRLTQNQGASLASPNF